MKKIKSISLKSVIIFLFIAITLAVYIPVLYYLYQQSNDFFESETDAFKKVINGTTINILSYGIESDNQDLIDNSLSNIVPLNFLHSLTVLDEFGKPISYKENIMYQEERTGNLTYESFPIYSSRSISESMVSNDLLAENKEVIPKRKVIGYLKIATSKASINAKVRDLLFKTSFISLLLIIFVALITSFYMFRFLSHFEGLIYTVKSLSKGDEKARYTNKAVTSEIIELSKYINDLGKNIETAWKEIEESEKNYELKNSILQIAAHELRTPIGSLKTFLDIAMAYVKKDDKEKSISVLHKCFLDISALDRHITSILALSAYENNSLVKNDEWVLLTEIFDFIENTFAHVCRAKGDLDWNCFSQNQDINTEVFIDFDLITLIIGNAVDNAIKYTNHGFVRLSYMIKENKLCITVHDSGVGMSDDEVNRVKTSPKQLTNNIRRSKDGWGIGVDTMQEFTYFLNGEFKLESKKGFGTKVIIEIPVQTRKRLTPELLEHNNSNLGKPVVDESLNSNHLLINKEDAEIELSSDNIDEQFNSSLNLESKTEESISMLIIDNDVKHSEQINELVSLHLKGRNIKITSCQKACEAIHEVEQKKYDLLLIDYHMPEMDGLCLLKYLSKKETNCKDSVKIILTADKNIPQEIKKEMITYADDIYYKGITSVEIKEIIRDVTLKAV